MRWAPQAKEGEYSILWFELNWRCLGLEQSDVGKGIRATSWKVMGEDPGPYHISLLDSFLPEENSVFPSPAHFPRHLASQLLNAA